MPVKSVDQAIGARLRVVVAPGIRIGEGKAALLGDLISVLLAPYDDLAAFSGRIRVSVPRMGVGESAATTLALVINYPRLADQRARLMAHSGSVLSVAIMVLAAGAFTGVLAGAGMIDAMAASVVAVLPPELGPHLAAITALISLPMTFFLSNDAFYFGILPVIAEAGRAYGISPEEIGRASLLGQPVHGLSPLVAAVYLKCAILNVELADLQRFALKYAIGVSLVVVAAALSIGAVPLSAG